ncbi:sigma-70 family RNA polymerase sigma factor [Agitococcus lubricus]|uniref:RNA polymerase sigma-70 factor (ECF subfamily) n=1 Tax=Agitococcus lubricus TaxID=1077255 RepID=A0A2T5J3S0_9GAMM|nr:sigma-70 family RNA polymerase sigma factor [Agitococcus lubricus]PTQ91153.1 RNA polymerase sigma-70 factor (ECF subfamily) [Agitococcus lubricus]
MMQDEQVLIQRLLKRETLACRQLVQTHHNRLLAVARSIVGEAAEDVVQEAWLLAFKALANFEGRSTLKTWLTRIVINTAYNRYRYEQQRLMASLDQVLAEDMALHERFDDSGHWQEPLVRWQAETPDEILARQELAAILAKACDNLPSAQRLAWLLRDQSGLEFSEIASHLHTSEANVRVLLHRARLKLLAVIEAYEEGKPC